MDCDEGLNEKGFGLETVRVLHQTVISLRAALEESKTVISELKSRAWPIEAVEQALQTLSIENHALRKKLLNADGFLKTDATNRPEFIKPEGHNSVNKTGNDNEQLGHQPFEATSQPKLKKLTKSSPKQKFRGSFRNLESKISVKAKTCNPKKLSRSLESLTVIKSPLNSNHLSFTKTVSFANLSSNITREFNLNPEKEERMSEKNRNLKDPTENSIIEEENEEPLSQQNDSDQNEEVDDIELIFTTEDTKESDFKEHLVSIDSEETRQPTSQLLQLALGELDQNLETSERELEDDVFDENFDNENQENANISSYDLKRENSQLNDSKSDNSINQERSLKSYYSFQDSSFENRSIEKDESFDRFEERIRIVETDISKCGIQDIDYSVGRRNTCPNPIQYRPLIHRDAMSKVSRKTRPILTHSNAVRKESEAQTDISAIPGSSWRSESSLASKARLGDNFTTLPSKYPLPGNRLRLSEKTVETRRILLSDIGFTSMVPELSRSADHLFPPNIKSTGATPNYGQFLKTSDLYSPAYTSQKFTWTNTATASPSDLSQGPSRYGSVYPFSSPPTASRRCSAPVSPSRRAAGRPAAARVRFANGSLPELGADWAADSGDSTDSLVEEAENYLRRSIDCITGGRDTAPGYSQETKSVLRRASAPEASRDNIPPAGWLPFLPRVSRDLKLDHWVKVITTDGRVRGGRVRYIGPVGGQKTEQYVGVQLSNPDGYCDGTHLNRRYFQCEPYHGIFVPFKKVIMGWRP